MKKRLMTGLVMLALVLSLSPYIIHAGVEQNKAVSQRYFEEYWAQNNYEIAEELFTLDFISHNPFGGDMDAAAHQDYVQGIFDASPDTLIETGVMIGEGEWVATPFYMEGTSTDEWSGIPPTGEQWTLNGFTIHRLEDGKIAEEWSYLDTMNLLQQLEALPYEDIVPMQQQMEILVDTKEPTDVEGLIDDWLGTLDDPNSGVNLVTTDVVVHEPLAFFREDIVGREYVIYWIGTIRERMPDFMVAPHPDTEEVTIISEGNLALMMAELQFTFDQEVSGIPPNDARIRVPEAVLFRFENNRIAEVWIRYDTMHWMNQMLDSS